MHDLMRDYKLLFKGKLNAETTDDSDETESQPLRRSTSSTTSEPNFGSTHHQEPCIFKPDSDDIETEIDLSTTQQIQPLVAAAAAKTTTTILLQNKLNQRKLFYPSSYDNDDRASLLVDCCRDNTIYYDDINTTNLILARTGSLFQHDESFANYKNNEPRHIETHSSVVTIFAIWNTTVGTSLLSMSWGIERTGLIPAIVINLLVAALCLYTTYTLLKVNEKHGTVSQSNEVSDLCKLLIGQWAEILARIFSLIVLIGANIVYWILMSNFFYHSVQFIYGFVLSLDRDINSNNSLLCPKLMNNSSINRIVSSLMQPQQSNQHQQNYLDFDRLWDLYSTVPFIMAFIMFPMLNWKSATFFTKFNSLGTLSVLYLIVFVAAKAAIWGINIPNWCVEFELKSTFCALTGMLSLSYFIHNIIISVMRNNRNQENNGRDLTIAFTLITFTYLFIGVLFYVAFPLAKTCIEDNLLNNFDKYDTLTIIARILLLFQLFTVFPLIAFMLRNEIFTNINMIFKNDRYGDFTYARVVAVNVTILAICVLFACFLPKIGTLIRYTGALSGLVYIFMLPSLLKIASLVKDARLTACQLVIHLGIIVIGCANLVSQFFITDDDHHTI